MKKGFKGILAAMALGLGTMPRLLASLMPKAPRKRSLPRSKTPVHKRTQADWARLAKAEAKRARRREVRRYNQWKCEVAKGLFAKGYAPHPVTLKERT